MSWTEYVLGAGIVAFFHFVYIFLRNESRKEAARTLAIQEDMERLRQLYLERIYAESPKEEDPPRPKRIIWKGKL